MTKSWGLSSVRDSDIPLPAVLIHAACHKLSARGIAETRSRVKTWSPSKIRAALDKHRGVPPLLRQPELLMMFSIQQTPNENPLNGMSTEIGYGPWGGRR